MKPERLIITILLLVSATHARAQQTTWIPTGSLITPRSGHTATLLEDGKVLVGGGLNVVTPCCTTTANAELYDPATGLWSVTGNPITPRGNHVAVRLQNGRVLIAGGNGDPFSTLLSSAEIYDPATGTWSAAGNMSVGRQAPRATLLANGKVLVVGGTGVTTAEVYDPATNAWSSAGTTNAPRGRASVALLPDGRVLVAGGSFNFQPLSSAEIYDPVAGSWTLTGELTAPRMSQASTVLANGKVLVAGGFGVGLSTVASAELYDPATGRWTAIGNMNSVRISHTLTLLASAKVLASGGTTSGFEGLLKSAELYDPATGNWTPTDDLNLGHQNHTATLLRNGMVLVAGGSGPAGQLTFAELLVSNTAPPLITNAFANGNKLFVEGQNFDEGARVFVDDGKQKTANDESSPTTLLRCKKAGKFIEFGQTVRIKVRNSEGTESAEFMFRRPLE